MWVYILKSPPVLLDTISIEHLNCPIWVYDIDLRRILWANDASLLLWEAPSLEELLQRNFNSGESRAVQETLQGYLEKFKAGETVEVWWEISPKGTKKKIFCLFSGIQLNDGRYAMLVEARHSTLLQNQQYDHQTVAMTALFDVTSKLISCNPPFIEQFGNQISCYQQLFPEAIDFRNIVLPEQIYEKDILLMTLMEERWHHAEIRLQKDDLNDSSYYVMVLIDVHERKLRELKNVKDALSDPLTGMLNRRGLEHHLNAFNDQHYCVFYIDLDGFKLVNDTYGHHVGDELLIKISEVLIHDIYSNIICARLGGDEFLLAIPEQLNNNKTNHIAATLIHKLSQPFVISNDRTISVSASIGTATYPKDGIELSELIVCADSAMYLAKKQGRNRHVFYTEGMGNHLRQRTIIIQDLEQAILDNQLELYYQPVNCLSENNISIVEALLRWDHPVLGFISPLDVISTAEETGKIGIVEEWVITRACSDLRQLKAHFGDQVKVSINISGAHISQKGFSDKLNSIAVNYQCEPKEIIIELTETVLLPVIEDDPHCIDQVKAFGFLVAIDDFGTGFSSLAYLSRIPADYVKIDKAFVDGLDKDAHTVEFIRSLCEKLGMKCITEGVETQHQSDVLLSVKLDLQQGYLFYKPMPIAKLILT
ncbi:MAG: EAL domain-containing protein [Bermanella sp.]